MKNLKKLKRNDLSEILGSGKPDACGSYPYALFPTDGSCPAGYIYCTIPNCCFKADRPYPCALY